MKSKLKKALKTLGIIVGAFLLLTIIIGVSGDNSEPLEAPVTEVSEQETEQEEASNDTVVEEENEPEVYTLKSAGDGLEYMKINLWKSYEDRTLIVGLEAGTEVELLQREVIGDIAFDDGQGGYEYCEVTYEDLTGWLDCAWLQ